MDDDHEMKVEAVEDEYMEDEEAEDEEAEDEELPSGKRKVYVPGVSRELREGEVLDFDPDAYRMFHTFETELPCLSFDVVRDNLGESREAFPLECYLVGGTQAEKMKDNQLVVMHLSNMKAIKKEDEDDSSSEDDSSDDDDENTNKAHRNRQIKKPLSAKAQAKLPNLHAAVIPHYGDINRIKSERLGSTSVAAVWNDQAQGRVQIWNLSPPLERLSTMEGFSQSVKMNSEKPLFSFNGHSAGGYALSWSPLRCGALASGDNHKKIFVWSMSEAGKWVVDQRSLVGHESSVEDLQWSPTEEPLLTSCSADGSLRLWDTRVPGAQACVHTVKNAHDGDVNVLSWNANEPLIVTGGDDAALKIWSLKTIQYNQSVAMFRHHKAPITSVEWSSNDTTTFMASGEDNQITIWDLAMEEDSQESGPVVSGGDADTVQKGAETKIPPQLLFVHMGATELKEIHWHKQITGLAISTALDGFHVFRTINI